jgi:FkbM family methyltransferase
VCWEDIRMIKTIKHLLRNLVLQTLCKFNLVVTRRDSYLNHKARSEEFFLKTRDGYDFVFFQELMEKKPAGVLEALKLIGESKAQLRQDLLVLWLLDFKRNGVFIEFGATDGVDLSNTYLLEDKYGWSGILAEPALIWHEKLRVNRKCVVDLHAISSSSGQLLDFFEAEDARYSVFGQISSAQKSIKYTRSYSVRTKTLFDLIEENNLPNIIDYISIDTEGSEFDILNSFNFDKYTFRVMTVEHSNTTEQEKVFKLLTSKGYTRILSDISSFDDWFVKPHLTNFGENN